MRKFKDGGKTFIKKKIILNLLKNFLLPLSSRGGLSGLNGTAIKKTTFFLGFPYIKNKFKSIGQRSQFHVLKFALL